MRYKGVLIICAGLATMMLILGCVNPLQEQVNQEIPVSQQVNPEMPALQSWVNDYANLLSSSSKSMLEARLAQLEKDTTAEVAVATINTIEGKNIDDYATTLFNKWGLGKKDKNNGVLFLIVLGDRKTRIEVGYGLESVITNELARIILDEKVLPQFAVDDYETGILNGVQAIEELVRKDNQ